MLFALQLWIKRPLEEEGAAFAYEVPAEVHDS